MISMFEKHIFMPSIHALHNFRDLGLHVHMSLLSVLCYQLYLLMGFVKPAILLGSKPRPRMIHGPAAVSFCPTGISIRYACQPMDVLQIFPASINWLYEILSCKMSWWKAMPRRCLWRKAAPNPLNCYKQPASGPTRWAIGSEFPGCTGGVVLFLKRPFCVSPVQKLQLLDTETHTHTHKHAHTHTNLNWSIALETASWFFLDARDKVEPFNRPQRIWNSRWRRDAKTLMEGKSNKVPNASRCKCRGWLPRNLHMLMVMCWSLRREPVWQKVSEGVTFFSTYLPCVTSKSTSWWTLRTGEYIYSFISFICKFIIFDILYL